MRQFDALDESLLDVGWCWIGLECYCCLLGPMAMLHCLLAESANPDCMAS